MTKLKISVLLLSAGMLAFVACKKDDGNSDPIVVTPTNPSNPTPGPTPTTINALESTIANYRQAATQSFTISSANNAAISTNSGSTFQFYSGSFQDANGNAVTGLVEVEVLEAFGFKDMVLNNMQTLTDQGQLLSSAGEFRITARQNGQPLQLFPGATIDVRTPVQTATPNPSAMMLWNGDEGQNDLEWRTADVENVAVQPDSAIGGNGMVYTFDLDSLDFFNLDVFMGQGVSSTSFAVNLPSGYDNTNTMVWLVFPNQNTIAALSNFDATANQLNTGSWYTVPIGFDVEVVVLADLNGTYFYANSSVTVANNQTVTIPSLQSTTIAAFESFLDSL